VSPIESGVVVYQKHRLTLSKEEGYMLFAKNHFVESAFLATKDVSKLRASER
jgi:hypothetical protein